MSSFLQPLHPLWKLVGCGILWSGRQTALGMFLLEDFIPRRLLRSLGKCFNEFVSVAGLRNLSCYWLLTADSRSELKPGKFTERPPDNLFFHSSVGTDTRLVLLFWAVCPDIWAALLASRLSSGPLSTFSYGGHASHVSLSKWKKKKIQSR